MGLKWFNKIETARERFLRWHEDDCAAHHDSEEACSCGYLTAVKYLFKKRIKKVAA